MYRAAFFAAFIIGLFQVTFGVADDPKNKKAELKKAIENADIILVGKVTKTGLVAASSFDVGEIEARKILKGDEKIKTARFRFAGRLVPPYAKVGVEGVWILSKANKPGWRNVLSYQPLTEEETVRTIIKEEKKQKEDVRKMAAENLIADLGSLDGNKRVAATTELFRRGNKVLPLLKKAGARQVAPLGATIDGTKRLDMVYSVIEGFPPNPPNARAGYRTNAFGLHVEKGTTAEDIQKICQKHKCTLVGKFNAALRPSCYLQIGSGQSLEGVIRQILSTESKVTTINLNYFEG
jgi:hypothetical protein